LAYSQTFTLKDCTLGMCVIPWKKDARPPETREIHDGKEKGFYLRPFHSLQGGRGKDGDWRSVRPEIDHSRCIPSRNNRPSCFICWLYCPEAVVQRKIPVEIDLEYCKGCGICAEECPAKAIEMVEER